MGGKAGVVDVSKGLEVGVGERDMGREDGADVLDRSRVLKYAIRRNLEWDAPRERRVL